MQKELQPPVTDTTLLLDTEAINYLWLIAQRLYEGGKTAFVVSLWYKSLPGITSRMFGISKKTSSIKLALLIRKSVTEVTQIVESKGSVCAIEYESIICCFCQFTDKLNQALALVYAMYITHKDEFNADEFKLRVLMQKTDCYPSNDYIELVVDEFLKFYRKQKK